MQVAVSAISRRGFIRKLGASALATPFVSRPARAQLVLTCADPGGVYTSAFTEAFYGPFTAESGVAVRAVTRRANPATEIKAQVETGAYKWDLSGGVTPEVQELLTDLGLLEKLALSGNDVDEIPAEMRNEYYLANGLTALVLGYRTDIFKDRPETFADLWDTGRFRGPRSMRRAPRDTVEVTLRALGISGSQAYDFLSSPAGWDKVYEKLNSIKPFVPVWWESAAQSVQLLQSGEIVMAPTFNARMQPEIDAGGKVDFSWQGGCYSLEGWVIPKGTPNLDLARRFIAFCARADRQAAFTRLLANGPTNPGAYNHIPVERARVLPSYPANLSVMTRVNEGYWSKDKEKIEQRFTLWLQS